MFLPNPTPAIQSIEQGTAISVPVFASVDALVFGASSAAVAAALRLRGAGHSAVAVSARSYFGSETAGALRLTREDIAGDAPLLKSIAAADTDALTPGRFKRALDEALFGANVDFFFQSRPVAPILDEDGAFAGAVFASRTALFAVRAKVAIDASEHALLLQVCGYQAAQNVREEGGASWTVMAAEAPAAEGWREVGPAFDLPARKAGETQRLSLFRKTFAPSGQSRPVDQVRADTLLRTEHAFSGIRLAADFIFGVPSAAYTQADKPLATSLESLPEAAWMPAPGIFLAGPLLPLTSEAAEGFASPATRIACGELAADAARRRLQEPPHPEALRAPKPSEANWKVAETFARPSRSANFVDIHLPAAAAETAIDVLVAGGGTGGASAAIGSARAGARTVVAELQYGLGGVGTFGLIANYWFGNRVGFTREMDEGVAAFGGAQAPHKHGHSWHPEDKSNWLLRTLHAAGGDAWLGSFPVAVNMEGDRITGALVSTPRGLIGVRCRAVVDATGNCDVAAAAGAPCRVIGADHVAVQGSGLSPRNPNIHYRNSDHTFIDDSDIEGVTHAFATARAKFRDEFDTAPLIGTRERRQIHGDIELSPLDFLAGRTFPDTVFTAESNFDTHGFTVHPVFQLVPPHKKPLRAHVPFRCMLPQGLSNTIVTGLGMSAHRDALPAIRMQPDVQNQGYAAGLAAATLRLDPRQSTRQLNIRALQKQLIQVGILEEDVARHEDSFPLGMDAVSAAVGTHPLDLLACAVIVGHADQAIPLLLEKWRGAEGEVRAEAALVLGMLGVSEVAPELAARVDAQAWDEGWNYTGMGQFGRSSSPLDDAILALAATGDAQIAEPVLLRKIDSLPADPAFSHCRALAEATARLRSTELATALARLLESPGISGHARIESRTVVTGANPDPVETTARNEGLRELGLARGCFLAGDPTGAARRVLQSYAADLRGHFARHAQAVLATPPNP
ncbi:MAG: FAD-dependent oxidoreductase [Opitutales bacterium]|nr:FAD-dependent oxidoreductase [Opitutales bacterium]